MPETSQLMPPKISELDAAIDMVIGEDAKLLRRPPINMQRMRLHQFACLYAFQHKMAGPAVEVLREMLVFVN